MKTADCTLPSGHDGECGIGPPVPQVVRCPHDAAEPTVHIDYGRGRDLYAADLLSRQAELLSKHAAMLEAQPPGVVENAQAYNDRHARAKLARELSIVFLRAAEQEQKS